MRYQQGSNAISINTEVILMKVNFKHEDQPFCVPVGKERTDDHVPVYNPHFRRNRVIVSDLLFNSTTRTQSRPV